MRISDWSSDVCSSDLDSVATSVPIWTGSVSPEAISVSFSEGAPLQAAKVMQLMKAMTLLIEFLPLFDATDISSFDDDGLSRGFKERSEEHTSELQSLMRISYAVFCLQKKIKTQTPNYINTRQ